MREAIAWYEKKQPTLGEDLAAAIGRAFAEIERAPERWPTWQHEPDVRRFVLARFRFTVSYLLHRRVPFVVAVAHTSRKPDYWIGRLEAAQPGAKRKRPSATETQKHRGRRR